jgi:hypothetical protein
MSVTTKQVEAAIEARNERMDDLEERYDDLTEEEKELLEEEFSEQIQWGDKTVELPEVGTASYVDYEHINEDLTLIFKIGEQFFKITGFYSSYDADEWETEVTEVVPKEKTITVYEEI